MRTPAWSRAALATLASASLAAVGACSDSPGGGGGWPIGDEAGAAFPTFDGEPTGDPGPTPDPGPGDSGAPDAAPPDAGDTPAGPDAPPACPSGQGCDDGDPCTNNDQCTGGACAGTPITCADDVPCTDDACVAGVCQHVLAPGSCLVLGACWSDGQANPANTCQRCEASSLPEAWTSADGAGCDDGSACTFPDSCVGGVCVGTPLACPDDGNPCTASACVGGACQASALDGASCDDGDPCTHGDTCGGALCLPGPLKDADGDGAADQACGGADCDDGAAAAKPGLAEVCADGLDNDCDGLTDTADGDCGTGPLEGTPCAYHTDCYPEGVCALWAATGQAVCSIPCAGDIDCGAGRICSKLPGSAQVGYCEPPIVGTQPSGASCGDASECQSQICANGQCAATCLDEGHCPGADKTCALVGDLALGYISGACQPNPAGLALNGQLCVAGANVGSEFCASGHCDLMPYPADTYCQPLCKTQSDCLPTQECGIVIYANTPDDQAVLYDPLVETDPSLSALQEMRDAATGCFTRVIQGGSKTDGAVCSGDGQCQGAKCLALIPGDPTAYCTRYCEYDGDCVTGMRCKLEAITINSQFLQAFGTPQPYLWTYVRVCKFE